MSDIFGSVFGLPSMFGQVHQQDQLAAQNQASALSQAAMQGMSNSLAGYGNGLRSYQANLYGAAVSPPPVVNYAAEVKEADWERSYREKIEAETKLADEARAKADAMVEDLVSSMTHPYPEGEARQ